MLIGLAGALLLSPSFATAAEHNHNHNHFNPVLEALGNDIIGLTVCYRNGYLSEQDQEPAFQNLINYAGVDGQELGMYYMNSLGAEAEKIMSDEQDRALWTKDYCEELTTAYLYPHHLIRWQHKNHDHDGHAHNHADISPEVLQQDIERGRLLRIE
ncbi:hypothetical protein D1Z90_12170 [Motilimonas pumila]|uniref:DUF2796 domain-containing protein n=1 Tax=Motilimonas pumila TaxID=2303987 RepID=A0A418YDS5_9GAMM|nr:hypothetical protein D1Z90_12170 [Motilimonas pumila]